MMKRIVALVVVVAAGLTAALVLSQGNSGPLRVSGFVEADEIRVGSRVGGRVARVHVEEGQAVEAGAKLVELEPFDLLQRRARAEAELQGRQAELRKLEAGFRVEEVAQAKAQHDQLGARLAKLVHGPRKQDIDAAQARVRLARAELHLAKLEHQRATSLYAKKAASQQDLDQALTKLKAAEATVEVRQAALSELKEGTRPEDIAEAKAQLEAALQAWQLNKRGYRPEEIAAAKAAVAAAQATLEQIDKQVEELAITAPVELARRQYRPPTSSANAPEK